jgi:hypothetical protein
LILIFSELAGKWKQLRHYKVKKDREKRLLKSGAGGNGPKKIWVFDEEMNFLKKSLNADSSVSNIPDVSILELALNTIVAKWK